MPHRHANNTVVPPSSNFFPEIFVRREYLGKIRPSRLYCGGAQANVSAPNGEMPERSNGVVSKTIDGAIRPRVRIPISPPFTPNALPANGLLRHGELVFVAAVLRKWVVSESLGGNMPTNGPGSLSWVGDVSFPDVVSANGTFPFNQHDGALEIAR